MPFMCVCVCVLKACLSIPGSSSSSSLVNVRKLGPWSWWHPVFSGAWVPLLPMWPLAGLPAAAFCPVQSFAFFSSDFQ